MDLTCDCKEAIGGLAVASKITTRKWARSLWGAGILLFLVELSFAVDYVQAGLSNSITGGTMGWLGTLGMIVLKVTNDAIWNDGARHAAVQFVPLVLLPVLIVVLWITTLRRGVE